MINPTRFAFASGVFIGLLLGAGTGVAIADAAASPTVQEDDPAWDCVTMGNRICGPGNSNGVPAACYNDGGVIVAPWPCHIVINPDGSADVYEGLVSPRAAR